MPSRVRSASQSLLDCNACVRMRYRMVMLLLISCVYRPAFAQSGSPSVVPFDPTVAYQQASRPFDVVRRAPQNWSEIELAALKTMTDQAKADCVAHSAREFSGSVLLSYARLCALGQDWKPVQEAAEKFVTAARASAQTVAGTSSHDLALAYDYKVQASIRLDEAGAAMGAASMMLQAVPYDDLVSEATTSAIRYTQLQHTDWALSLLSQRQPTLLALLRAHAAEAPTQAGMSPSLSVPDLYAQAVALPTMQQLNNQGNEAAASYAELEATLPKTLSAEEKSRNAAVRRQYLLLGSHLPKVDTFAWLPDTGGIGLPPAINEDKSTAKVYLLFPDWCNQCIALHDDFGAASRRLLQDGVRFFALLAQDAPPPRTAPKDVTKTKNRRETTGTGGLKPFHGEDPNIVHTDLQLQVKPTAAALLSGTPTFVVPTRTLEDFAAADFPLIVVADHSGIIRAIQIADDKPLVQGGLIDQLVDHVIALWPATQP
jgi:hypothetical protein